MSIKDERDYAKFQSLMYLDVKGTLIDPGPYWVSNLPWSIEKGDLTNNKSAVLGVMDSTIRKLGKDQSWRIIYDQQLRDLLGNGFAREVLHDELSEWVKSGGSVYYIAHQMALNPSSKSTPVRVVFNSSQKFRGQSLNSSWELGPDVLNSLHGVLLRFRENYFAAQGDVKKMYYMIRIPKAEQMMQLFCWKFSEDNT